MGVSRIDRPVLLAIVGDSAAGKTTVAAGITRILGEDQVLTFCSDDYHSHSRTERRLGGLTAADPRCNYIDIVEQHLALLRDNQPILKPVYHHERGNPGRPEYVTPKAYIVVEGLLACHTRAMRDCFDVKVYLEPDEELRIKWKLQRDCSRRGYTAEEVRAELEMRKDDSPRFIHPQRTFADIVVNFRPPERNALETGAHLDVRHILRPTLPHPDLSPLVGGGARNGLALELSRDRDGKPVDMLEVSGDIDDRGASSLENLIWEMLPEARHLRGDPVGTYADAYGRERTSHPLALTQLMLAYHMVKAAHGVHVV